jgi:hypothetical protein
MIDQPKQEQRMMKCMDKKSDEFDVSPAHSVTRRATLRKFSLCLAGFASMALICVGLMNAAYAQTTVVCDPAGDARFGNGKGGPPVPDWLDIIQANIADDGDSILVTLTLNAPIPLSPAWSVVDEDGGQLWWSWRMVNDVADITPVSNGCLQANGQNVPACYCLDLIWSVQAASFRARLLDDTSCTETAIPFAFSPDRRAFSLLVPKALFTNAALIPNPNSFQFLTEIIVWKNGANGNKSLTVVDNAIFGTWSSSSNTTYGCP